MSNYEIVTKGGTMCFYGEWFGRPYDNYHKIVNAAFENDCLTIYFKNSEVLSIYNPTEIINEEHCFEVKQATKVVWQYTPYGNTADKNIAVQCLSY